MVTWSPRGRAFEDMFIQSCERTLEETVCFLVILFFDLFELDAKLTQGSSKSVRFVRFTTAASIFGTAFFRGKSFEGYLRNFLQA